MGSSLSQGEPRQRGLWRSRWAAIGAAVAVAFGAGGMIAVNAASSPASSVVTIAPVRILDTRDPVNIGLPGPFVSAVSQKLQVTGTKGVPAGATGVLLNVTVVGPSAAGFLSVRPGDATGAPSTSSLNFNAGQTVPNSVQVGLPTAGANAGQIDITYDAYGAVGPTTEVLIDVVGYMVAGAAGSPGPAGTATAWGSISGGFGTPTIVSSSSNVSAVVRSTYQGAGAEGQYCVRFNPAIPAERLRAAVVTGFYGPNYPVAITAASYCPAGELGVLLFDFTSGGLTKNGDFNFIVP